MRKLIEKIYKENEAAFKRTRKFKTQEDVLKYFLKREYKAIHSMPPKKLMSLMEDEHACLRDDESVTIYGFIPGSENCSDEEIKEILREEWIRICSPYDCTGKWFTMWIDWHRNPTGIVSYQHVMGLDV